MDLQVSRGMLMGALLCGSLVVAVPAVEAVGLQEFTLDTVVVTATRYEKPDLDVAVSTQIFDQQKLQATGASNLYEALQYGTGLNVLQYGTGGSSMGNMASKISIRGNVNGTLILLNGVPLNIRGTYDLNDIPLENVERVEIVRGGGSVLYGSDATGGVINIITKADKSNYVKVAVGNYDRREYAASVQADKLGFSYSYSKWGYVDNVGWDRKLAAYFKDWRGPENHNFDLTYKFDDNLSLNASHNESKYDYISTIGQKSMKGWSPANDTQQDVDRNNIQLHYQKDNFKATAYCVDREREKNAWVLDSGDFLSDEDETSRNYGLDIQNTYQLDNATLLVGASYQKENYKSTELNQKYDEDGNLDGGLLPSSTGGNRSRNNYSLYAQWDSQLNTTDSLILSARRSWTAAAPNGDNFHNFSGQAQFIHKIGDKQSLYASVGQSFKMPALYQIYKTDANGNSAKELKPQKGMHYELGWKKNIDQEQSLRVAVFNYRIDDNISANVDSRTHVFSYKNENIRNTGIEIEYAKLPEKGLGYNLSTSYGNPQTEEIDKNGYNFGWQDDGSRFEVKACLTYRLDKWKAAINAAYVADRDTFKNSSKKGSKPAKTDYYTAKPYLLTNLNVEYAPQEDLSIFANFNNILDRKDTVYYSSSSEHYATPFNFIVGMRYNF